MKVLTNADDVIALLSRSGPMSPAEIAERVGIPRPSVYRMLDGLQAVGLTRTLADSRAQLSLRWLHLADAARAAMTEWAGAPEVLSELVERTGQTAYLSVLRNDEAVCLEWQQGRAIGVLVLKPGRSLPLHAGAAGRTLLAHCVDLEQYLARTDRRQLTPATLVEAEALRADVVSTRERGFALSDSDVTEGIRALGAPVRDRSGRVVGAISVAGLVADLDRNQSAYLEALFAAADALGTRSADGIGS